MHITSILICHEDALGQLTWITDHSQNAIQQRIAQARAQRVYISRLSRAEFRRIDTYVEGALSKILDRSRSKDPRTMRSERLTAGFRRRNKPDTELLEQLERTRILEPKYQRWLTGFIDAVRLSPSNHHLFVR